MKKEDKLKSHFCLLYRKPTAPSLLNSLLLGFTNGAIATSSDHLIMAEQAGINTAFTSSLPNLFTTRDATYNSSLPKAFLNWALFDERFNYVSGGVTLQVQNCRESSASGL